MHDVIPCRTQFTQASHKYLPVKRPAEFLPAIRVLQNAFVVANGKLVVTVKFSVVVRVAEILNCPK